MERHWAANTREFLRYHLKAEPTTHLRIATGYFTVAGQQLLREGFETTAWILVGFEEAAAADAVESLVQNIQSELEAIHELTYEVVRRLADDLAERVKVVETRYRQGDHAKVYILGERAAVIGSANLSAGGMRRNAESLQLVDRADLVRGWLSDFDRKWTDPSTQDVTAELRSLLLEWLKFAKPFDTYLAACNALLDTRAPVITRADYKEPLAFQRVVARRAAASIARDTERGHWVIASTGLGKTIIATQVAMMLMERSVIREIIVIAPVKTVPEWETQMRTIHASARVFGNAALRRSSGALAQKLQYELDRATDQTLLIIDESHEFRNRYDEKGGVVNERTFAERLNSVVKEQGARVLLLTGTPYAKSVHGINNQLKLLPHTGTGEGTLGFSRHYPHAIHQVEEIYQLPVVTALSYPTVKQQFAVTDHTGTYLKLPNAERGYIEDLLNESVTFTPVATVDVINNLPLFEHSITQRRDSESRERSIDGSTVKRQLLEALLSSPAELERWLRRELQSPSNVYFRSGLQQRNQAVKQILSALGQGYEARDEKLQHLIELLENVRNRGEKALVFVSRLKTGQYLKAQLAKRGYKVDFLQGGSQDADKLITGFAPRANATNPVRGAPLNVLITTDTLSAGVNLQDATNVVHYDTPWAADVYHQRNGRILRFRPEPVTVRSYMFKATEGHAKLQVLDQRLQVADLFNSVQLIEEGQEGGQVSWEALSDTGNGRSSDVLMDFAILERHLDRAQALRHGLLTARYADVEYVTTVSVLKVDGEGEALCVQRQHHAHGVLCHTIDDTSALRAFRATEETEIATVPFQWVDELVRSAVQEFVEQSRLKSRRVRTLASVALIPPEHPRSLVP